MSGTTHKLVLCRHGESEWNKQNLFTGWKDPALTEKGKETAKKSGEELKKNNYSFDVAFTSDLQRAQNTCSIILNELGQSDLPTIKDQALNERDYGDLTGLNKDDARKKWGEEQVHIWRRSYDIAPPGGESLKTTGDRTLPYYYNNILPRVLKGEKVLVAAHGNSIRSIIKDLENLSPEEIVSRELPLGIPLVYTLDGEGKFVSKEILGEDN